MRRIFLIVVIVLFKDVASNTLQGQQLVNHEELLGEIDIKMKRLQGFMAVQNLEGILLTKVNNFAWITAGLGDNHILLTSETGIASLLILKNGKKYILANDTELPHLLEEEVKNLGYEPKGWGWWENKSVASVLKEIVGDATIGSDISMEGVKNVEASFNKLRYELTSTEKIKYKWLCRQAAEAVELVCKSIKPGMTDREIEAITMYELMKRGLRPSVILIGVDERLKQYYHYPPVGVPLKKHAFVNVCAKRWGMVTSVGRYVYFGKPPQDILDNIRVSATISAHLIHNSRAGVKAADMSKLAKKMYMEHNIPDEWKQIHQGGGIGYAEREWVATEDSEEVLQNNQALAWNPFTPFALSFDTILLTDDTLQVLTATPGMPTMPVIVEGKTYNMPSILVR